MPDDRNNGRFLEILALLLVAAAYIAFHPHRIHRLLARSTSKWSHFSRIAPAKTPQTKHLAEVPDKTPLPPPNNTQNATFAELLDERWQIEAMASEGAQLIDSRQKSDFARDHDRRAMNVPYLGKDDSFDLKSLPEDKEKRLVFYGYSALDRAPLRAMTRAALAGWKHVYWYREGELGIKDISMSTPESYPGLPVVGASQIPRLLKRRHALPIAIEIDDKYSAETLPGSVSVSSSTDTLPFATDEDTLNKFPPDLEMRAFPRSKSVPLVIYGNDRQDWRAFRVAVWFKNAGWPVYWYRGGALDWSALQNAPRAE
jgi:rhodanese-related sulfurtransferase